MLTRKRCCCVPGECVATIRVFGCPSWAPLPLSDATVAVWDTSAKGTSYGSDVSDSNGDVEITLPGAGTYYIETSHARYETISGDYEIVCNEVNFITYIPDDIKADYQCIGCCAWPVAKELTFTSDQFGTWTGDISLVDIGSSPGGLSVATDCNGCASPRDVYPSIQSFPPPDDNNECHPILLIYYNAIGLCPKNTQTSPVEVLNYSDDVSVTCPPSFSLTGTANHSTDPGDPIKSVAGCSFPWSDTITVTE